MMNYSRYAIYVAPEPGPLAEFGAQWLGWDCATGQFSPPPDLPHLPISLNQITETPRKYGFHGTVKPPFYLAEGCSHEGLHKQMSALAQRLRPVTLDGLQLQQLGHFLALTPKGDTAALAHLAGTVVRELDTFRAPPSPAELSRRRPDHLTEAQRALLARWGYPYVMEEFRFHLTLTGRLRGDHIDRVAKVLRDATDPILPNPFTVNSLCLFGQDQDGRFHNLHRYTLCG